MKTHILVALLCTCTLTLSHASAPQKMQLFLLIGQSNMAGRGKVEACDQVASSQIWMLDKQNCWVAAKDPLHFDKPKVAGVGLASEFARCVAKKMPSAAIGLIPCAFGGTSLDQWKPGSDLYSNAVARAKIALKDGQLAGILWHQGEADSSRTKIETYAPRFATMIAHLRRDLNAPDVPVIVGELGNFNEGYKRFNANLPTVVRAVKNCQQVSADGLEHGGDNVHFSAAALREFGRRYFECWQKLTTP